MFLCVGFLSTHFVNAEGFKNQTVVINEFDALKSLNKELQEFKKSRKMASFDIENFSEEDLYIIENYEDVYRKKIEELNKKDIDDLEFLKYDKEQIDAIKNFDGSEEMIRLASSRLSLTTQIKDHVYNSRTDKTTAKLDVDFIWNGSPTVISSVKDCLGIVWSGDYVIDTSSSYLEVTYLNDHYRERQYREYDIDYRGLNKAQFAFTQHVTYTWPSGNVRGYDVSEGRGVIYFSDIERISRIRTYSSYGHNSIKGNPSFSIDSEGSYGIGIDWDWGIKELDYDYQNSYL